MPSAGSLSRGWLVALALIVGVPLVVAGGAPSGVESAHVNAVVASPNRGPAGNQLRGTACPTTTWCVAVGNAANGATTEPPLIERLVSGTWVLVTPPRPANHVNSTLSGVSCTSTTFCMAAGNYVAQNNRWYTFTEKWNGSVWKVQHPPSPQFYNDLQAISCRSATFCLAVGYQFHYSGATNYTTTLVEQYNGSSWAVKPSYNQNPISNMLSGVSCTSTTNCIAVGWDDAMAPLAERWNGTSAVADVGVNPPGDFQGSELGSVSCTSTTFCLAAGQFIPSTPNVANTLIEKWNGSVWSYETSANEGSNLYGTSLTGVSCASAIRCLAVGNYGYPPSDRPFAALWNGANALTTDPTGFPFGSTGSALVAVSCPTTTRCYSAGSYVNASHVYKTLIEKGP